MPRKGQEIRGTEIKFQIIFLPFDIIHNAYLTLYAY